MLAPAVSISLSQKKKLIADVKSTGARSHERKDIVRKFLKDNGIKGEMVVVNLLKSDGAVKSTKKGES
jgi:hypothetical protein